MKTSTNAIILGHGATAIGAMRCLAREGIPVQSVVPANDLACKSRYFKLPETPSGAWCGAEWTLEQYSLLEGLPEDRYVLVPCSDLTARWTDNRPDSLRRRFVSSCASGEALDALLDKRIFADLCRRLKVPHPESILIKSPDDLDAIPIGGESAWFFKPSNSLSFLSKYGKKAMWFSSRADAEQLLSRFSADAVDVFAQEYVPGGADQHYFIDGFRDRFGTVRGLMARRRWRIYPPDFGNSSYCEAISLESVQPAWESLERILEALSYRGIFSAEFKYDRTKRQFRILEINARVWVYVEFAASCGMNVVELAYLDALELDLPDMIIGRNQGGCVDMYRDVKCLRGQPSGSRPGLLTVLGQWWSSRKALFCWDDPLPGIHWAIRLLRARFSRVA